MVCEYIKDWKCLRDSWSELSLEYQEVKLESNLIFKNMYICV